jgi:hypothetical protein
MHDEGVRDRAYELHDGGATASAISRELSVPRSTVRDWLRTPHEPRTARRASCFVCDTALCPCPDAYGYLLGQYLGDGYLVTSARVPRLRITCADAYPGIAAEADRAMTTVSGGNSVTRVRYVGCSDHVSYWMHWPCVLPQHGPGRKHERRIELLDWQQQLVERDPWPLIRGLIHSDGCRALNRVTVRGVPYAYPRYFFSNESADILSIMGHALDLAAVAWRYNRPNCISIARRAAVLAMDARVGPKT